MNEKLIVKNFGPIKDAELDLKKVTVFIGPQGSGKSTLAKLVAICKLSERPMLSPDTRPILGYTTDFGLHINTKEDSLFQYKSNISSLSLKNKEAWKVFSNLGNKINQQVEEIYKRIRIIDSLGDSSSDSLISVYQKYLKLLSENNITEPIYIPTERFLLSTISSSIFGLMSNNINLPKILTEFGNKFSSSIAVISNDDFKDKDSKSFK
jgi:energy-coupling factor transporter ATP-binding protein EcfA2